MAIPEPNEVLCRMRLDLDGILEVTAVEKQTGKSKHLTIANAARAKSPEEIAAGRKRIQELYESRGEMADEAHEAAVQMGEEIVEEVLSAAAAAGDNVVTIDGGVHANREVEDLLGRSRRLLDSMHSEDREEAIDLHERIEAAIESRDDEALRQAGDALKELLFFVEGQR